MQLKSGEKKSDLQIAFFSLKTPLRLFFQAGGKTVIGKTACGSHLFAELCQ